MPQANIDWNQAILDNPDRGNIFQSVEFAAIKQSSGWKSHQLTVQSVAITVLEKSVPLLGKLWYIPKGPGLLSVSELGELLPDLHKLAQKSGVFALKLEPEISKTDQALADLVGLGLQKVTPIQPNFSTVLIDLTPDIDGVLASLNQKGRHAIRRAERDGVTVERVASSDDNCRQMYDLLSATAAGSFAVRSYDYYRAFWQQFEQAGLGQMFFAYYDGQLVAAAYALVFGDKSTYKDGASVRQRTAYGASHLLQWEVIKWAQENGSQTHDLCGAPPADQISNPDHPHYGIGRFKTSFNKTITEYVGAYDLVINPVTYRIWSKIGERLVKKLHWHRHHENYY